MESGVLFYWFCWILWILITFFMDKGRKRSLLAIWLLITIISSAFMITIGQFHISASFVVMLFGSFILIATRPHLYFHLFAAFTVSIGYAGLLFWEKISPIWIILPRIVFYSVIIGILISLLSKNYFSQISICLLGMLSGELIHSLTLTSYGLDEIAAETLFLDTLLSTLLLLTFLAILLKGKRKYVRFIHHYKQNPRWQLK
ncbi:hypothetical protein D8M04_02655 [Oceanobacillus piezotolerans]|uniref:Uncharacterized protein n=1 Tax=Oceanobacillus piezotolerans TaxID=2448030 RepID=A0A498DAP6_9BACI|nr:hypothetical protein [Oceanobacillus piezotolerans]RLL48194.1 hypothetical protein D8M04_02655 [Oceanobacillus piezotolerans]